jgi:hypothetical protein
LIITQTTTTITKMSAPPSGDKDAKHDEDLDKLFSAFASAANGGKKKEYDYDDFRKMMDETPLFMRETPTEVSEENAYVLEALKSLAFEGDGDGEYRVAGRWPSEKLPASFHPFLSFGLCSQHRDRSHLQGPRQRTVHAKVVPGCNSRLHPGS